MTLHVTNGPVNVAGDVTQGILMVIAAKVTYCKVIHEVQKVINVYALIIAFV